MKNSNRTAVAFASALSAALAMAQAAQAEISPREAWEKLNEFINAYNYTVTIGDQNDSGDMLSLRDVKLSLSQDEFSISETIPNIDLKQAGDGSVFMTVSPQIALEVVFQPGNGRTATLPMISNLDGFLAQMDIVEGKFTVDYSADAMSIELTEIITDRASVPVPINFSASDIEANYAFDENFDGDFSSTISIASMDASGGFDDPGQGSFNGKASYQNLLTSSEGTMPKGVNLQDPMMFITGGVFFNGKFTHQGVNVEFDFTSRDGSGRGAWSGAVGAMEFGISADGLSFAGIGSDIAVDFAANTVPLPVSIAADSASFSMSMPIAKSDDPQSFDISTRLSGLTVGETIWSMVDPTSVLPRDPANIVMDMSGKMALFVDLFDEEAMDAHPEPGQIHALDINEVRLNVAGADLTGKGAFTFDNDQPSPFGTGPKPAGSLDLQLVGGNGLIDNLISLGLLPQDQAMAGRMMLGLFARPGDGPDTLTSKIEITPEGGVLANGQRLQ